MFFLGVGTQKAGTSWLHQYFANHPQVAVPPDKEVHYLDLKYGPDHMVGMLRRRQAKLAKADALGLSPERRADLAKVVQFCEQLDDQAYVSYLKSFCLASTVAYGEITPSYCMLSADAWRQASEQLPKDTKIIFLLRDPVMRLFSAAKMIVRDAATPISLEDAYAHVTSDPGHLMRTGYGETLAAVESAFGKNRVFVGFYEALFSDATILSVCNFLGIDFVKPNYGKKENVSKGEIEEIPQYLVRVARSKYDPVYKAIRARYPAQVEEYWDYARMHCN